MIGTGRARRAGLRGSPALSGLCPRVPPRRLPCPPAPVPCPFLPCPAGSRQGGERPGAAAGGHAAAAGQGDSGEACLPGWLGDRRLSDRPCPPAHDGSHPSGSSTPGCTQTAGRRPRAALAPQELAGLHVQLLAHEAAAAAQQEQAALVLASSAEQQAALTLAQDELAKVKGAARSDLRQLQLELVRRRCWVGALLGWGPCPATAHGCVAPHLPADHCSCSAPAFPSRTAPPCR